MKTLYRVCLQQYVEQVTTMEIEADSAEQAEDMALQLAPDANWEAGDDAYDVRCYQVENLETGDIVMPLAGALP